MIWTILGAIVGVVGGITGVWGLVISQKQWKKVNKKVAILSDSESIYEVLPAWYTSRMVDEYWMFGLYTLGGQTILIRRILSISDDSKWMDVELATTQDAGGMNVNNPITAVAEDRVKASVQISSIVAATDLGTS